MPPLPFNFSELATALIPGIDHDHLGSVTPCASDQLTLLLILIKAVRFLFRLCYREPVNICTAFISCSIYCFSK